MSALDHLRCVYSLKVADFGARSGLSCLGGGRISIAMRAGVLMEV